MISSKPLELYWDQSPETLFQEVEGMPEYGRRTAVSTLRHALFLQ